MEIYLCWVLFGDTSGLSATNYKESSGWEFIPAGCSLGIPVLQLGQTPHMPGKFPVRAPASEELLSSGNPLSDLSVIGVVDLHPQGTPGPSQPRRHQNLQSPSQNPLSIARVAAPPVPVDITSPPLGIRLLTSTDLFSPPSVLPSVSLPNHPPLSPISWNHSPLDTESLGIVQTPEWDNYDSGLPSNQTRSSGSQESQAKLIQQSWTLELWIRSRYWTKLI